MTSPHYLFPQVVTVAGDGDKVSTVVDVTTFRVSDGEDSFPSVLGIPIYYYSIVIIIYPLYCQYYYYSGDGRVVVDDDDDGA